MRLSELQYAVTGVIGQVRMINSHGSTQRHNSGCRFVPIHGEERYASPAVPLCEPPCVPLCELAMDDTIPMHTHS